MGILVTGFIGIFRDLGTSAALIQKRDVTESLKASLFWVNLGFGLAMTAACFFMAPIVASFFREPLVSPVLRVLSLSFLIYGIASVHLAQLNRRMDFKRISLVEIGSAVVGLAATVVLACLRAGVWSLVAGVIVSAAAGSLSYLLLYRWRPKLWVSLREIRSVMNFGANLSAFNILNYFARNADNAVIGRFLGSMQLGFYQLAYNIMLFPVWGIAQLVCRVLFPAFSEMQHDNERFCRAYLRACSLIALITFPLMTGAGILARPLIGLVYGPQWGDAVPVLMILTPVGVIQSVFTTTGQIYTAKGRTDLMFKVGGVCAVLMVASFFIGLPWGIRGVATSYAICVGILTVPSFMIAFSLIGLRLREFVRALAPVISSTALMAIVVVSARVFVRSRVELPMYADLLLFTALGALVYSGKIYLQRPPVYLDLIALLGSWRMGPARAVGQPG